MDQDENNETKNSGELGLMDQDEKEVKISCNTFNGFSVTLVPE